MKLVTMTITLVLVGIGYGMGWYGGHAAGRDEVHTSMMASMSDMGMPQMRGPK